ncbi:hypothetical protein U9M48_036879 [Paspalum notatum var. saurae]|uniref:Uncharacterized protein n=1 Tax=Paspalum notatum var. saurae TaxID=547442 RepID=A0AAQ3UFZ3_PASNO
MAPPPSPMSSRAPPSSRGAAITSRNLFSPRRRSSLLGASHRVAVPGLHAGALAQLATSPIATTTPIDRRSCPNHGTTTPYSFLADRREQAANRCLTCSKHRRPSPTSAVVSWIFLPQQPWRRRVPPAAMAPPASSSALQQQRRATPKGMALPSALSRQPHRPSCLPCVRWNADINFKLNLEAEDNADRHGIASSRCQLVPASNLASPQALGENLDFALL